MTDGCVPMPRVAAVIVTYNRLAKLKTTIERTLALPFCSIIVVNNASTDGTGPYLESLADPRLRIVHEPVNLGGAGGFAHGFENAARQTDCDWLLCYDDDAYPAPDALSSFAALAPGHDVAGVAAAVYFPDGRICAMNRPGMDVFRSPRTLWRAIRQKTGSVGIGDAAYARTQPADIGFSSFVGLFVRCDLVRGRLGLPRRDLFIYRDDSLYTLSITQHGYRLLFAPAVRFVHDCTTPTGGRCVYTPLWKAYYVIRNDLPFFRALAGGYFYAILPLLILKWLLPTMQYTKPWLFLRVAALAISDGLRGDFTRPHADILALTSPHAR
ncbi:MAG: glycosyltransferase [Acetobacter sp.]|uniref:glycosyltransferase n=1 Tax=Acetobacter sp. TaxID=440 RepID=UPI0039EBFD31